MIEFDKYAKIKDNYCVCYFGSSDEYLVLLKLLKPVIESIYSGLKIHFGCKDNKVHLFDNIKVMKISEIKEKRDYFAHIREIRYNGSDHPIEELLKEASIKIPVCIANQEEHTVKAFIAAEGSYPTKPLEKRQIEILKKIIQERRFELANDAKNAGMVVGVESVELFDAAGKGVRTILVPTGIGTKLYKNLFKNGEVLNI